VSIPEDLHRLSQGAAARSPAAALGSSSSRSAGIPQTCTLLLAEQKYNMQPQNNNNNQLGTQKSKINYVQQTEKTFFLRLNIFRALCVCYVSMVNLEYGAVL
jgi:hypothetical protein